MIQVYFIDQFYYEKVALSSHITVYGGIRIHQSIAFLSSQSHWLEQT